LNHQDTENTTAKWKVKNPKSSLRQFPFVLSPLLLVVSSDLGSEERLELIDNPGVFAIV
jgi:hypothetical protein